MPLAHPVRVDAGVLDELHLLLGCGLLLPRPLGLVVKQCHLVHVHEERQRVNQSRLTLCVGPDGFCERVPALLLNVGECVEQLKLVLNGLLGHPLGVLVVARDERRGAAEVVPGREPQEVKQQAVVLVRGESRAPAHHLTVETPHLCRPEHHHAVRVGAVIALREQHGVGQHRALASL